MDEYCESEITEFLRKLQRNKDGGIFLQPIEDIINQLPLYKVIIERPIDLVKIINKFKESKYNNLLEIKEDLDLMIQNCYTFNKNSPYIIDICSKFQQYFQTNWEKLYNKIEKRNEKKKSYLNQKRLQSKEEHTGTNHAANKQAISEKNDNVAIFLFQDEKLEKRIRNLFEGFKAQLDLTEENQENLIKTLIKNISKRNKTFGQIYETNNNYVMDHLPNEYKSKFAKKFQKLLRNLEEEQNEETMKLDSKALNIKIDLNENEEKREERKKIDLIKKDLKVFIEGQKVPDVFLDPEQYSIDPALKKKIYSHVLGIREKMCMGSSVEEPNDLADL